MYVDDVLTGADTVDSTMKLQQDMSEIMMKGALNLTKWASNSELAMALLPQLGVSWDFTSDLFRFLAPGGIVLSPDPMTKRSLASKMFAPLGLISLFTVRAKILFQELW